ADRFLRSSPRARAASSASRTTQAASPGPCWSSWETSACGRSSARPTARVSPSSSDGSARPPRSLACTRRCSMGGAAALRLDDVGAASKRFEVYGVTRLPLGPFRMPFPGNFLFLKYVPPIKRWGPYAELSAAAWEWIVAALEAAHARMTVGITAGWGGDDATATPFSRQVPPPPPPVRPPPPRRGPHGANPGHTAP